MDFLFIDRLSDERMILVLFVNASQRISTRKRSQSDGGSASPENASPVEDSPWRARTDWKEIVEGEYQAAEPRLFLPTRCGQRVPPALTVSDAALVAAVAMG